MVRDGEVGAIRFVAVEHASGWAATPLELTGHKQAGWRTNPDIAGETSVVADLGTHAFHLLRYITGLDASRVSADLSTLVPGRRVFDNAAIRLTLSNGAPATLWASMARRVTSTDFASASSATSRAWSGDTRTRITCRCMTRTAAQAFSRTV